MSPKKVLEVRTVRTGVFKTLIEALKELLTDVVIEFDADGMKIITTDTAHVILVHLRLYAAKFETYVCNRPKVAVGLNMLNLHKVSKAANSGDTLSMTMYEDEMCKLHMTFENAEKNSKATYSLNLMDMDVSDIEIPPEHFPSVITMPSGDFQKLIRDMHNIADKVEIRSIGNQLMFRCCGDFCSQETVLSDAANSPTNEIVQGVFNLRNAHEEKNLCCPSAECGKMFSTSRGLKLHLRTHLVDKPFKCTYGDCDQSFVDNRSLAEHIRRSHTGEKPYACTFDNCGKTFVAGCELTVHMRSHTGEKPFRCAFPLCGRTFAQHSHLKGHGRVHTPEFAQSRKREEQKVADLLTANGIDFKREHKIDFSCIDDEASSNKFARIDFLLLVNGVMVFLEVDEDQHRFGYTVACDMKRMATVVESLRMGGNDLPTFFLRYNPHAYSVGGVEQKASKMPQAVREAALLDVIKNIGPQTGLSVQYMYFDCDKLHDGSIRLCVHNDPEYNESMKECCRQPIV